MGLNAAGHWTWIPIQLKDHEMGKIVKWIEAANIECKQ